MDTEISSIPFTGDISVITHENTDFRRIIHNTATQQLIVMSLCGKEDTGYHKHPFSSQFIKIESGNGWLYIRDTHYKLEPGVALIIPAGVPHMIGNTMKLESLKLYTIYVPPTYEHSLIRNDPISNPITNLTSVSPSPDIFYGDLEDITNDNMYYRHVLFTTPTLQLVAMSLLPQQEIGMEAHPYTTQFFRITEGEGIADVGGKQYMLCDDAIVVVPPNTDHNIINTSRSKALKLYTVYSPPEHAKGEINVTRP